MSLWAGYKDGSPLQGSAFMGVRNPGFLHPSEQRTFAGDPVFTLGWDMSPLWGLESARFSGAALYSTFVATCFRRHPEE
jgi:hypothetical protein